MKNIILFLTFSFLTHFLEGQETTTSIINIRATTSVSGQEFLADIFRNQGKIKILYKIKESISDKIENDTNLTNYRQLIMSVKNLTPHNDTVSFYLGRIDSIYQMYKHYDADSLQFNRNENKDFDHLLNVILSSSNEILENKSANKNILTLDGTFISFKLTDNDHSRVVYAYSPNPVKYPLLTKLITQTMDLYRQTNNNNFLNKSRTSGY